MESTMSLFFSTIVLNSVFVLMDQHLDQFGGGGM